MTLPQRKNIRLNGFDYRSNLAYFVTLCTQNRLEVFGNIEQQTLIHTQRGLIAQTCWQDLPNHHAHLELDVFTVMPNHVHGILCLVGATPASPASTLTGQSLGAIIGSYKSAVSRQINRLRPGAANDLWQRGYYDRIIRNEREHEAIWQYITENPRRWEEDEQNPNVVRPRTIADILKATAAVAGDAGVAPTKS